jgi:hypothetical protein
MKPIKPHKSTNRKIDKCYNNTDFDLSIRKSQIPNGGLGIYTNVLIPVNTVIGTYVGERVEDYNYMGDSYYYEIRERNDEKNISSFGITAIRYPRCYMAMINDAIGIKNNCHFDVIHHDDVWKSQVIIVALRDIQCGEELFIDYGSNYWKD